MFALSRIRIGLRLTHLVSHFVRRTNEGNAELHATRSVQYLQRRRQELRRLIKKQANDSLALGGELAEICESLRELEPTKEPTLVWDAFPSETGASDMDWDR
jgi:hypothetical protein